MRYKLLGTSGLRVSELAFGAMNFGKESWGTPDLETSRCLYDAYREAGGNLIDTANEVYSDGRSEEFVGQFIAGHRDEMVLATKYGFHLPGRDANIAGNHRKSLVRSLERSLRRLGTDCIDILWLHGWDTLTPVAEMMRALDDQIRLGKLLHVGVSNTPAWLIAQANTLAELRGWTPFTALQTDYSLAERGAERELLPMSRALKLGVLGYSPLANGILTGKYAHPTGDGGRRLDSARGMKAIDERRLALGDAVVAVADAIGRSPSQVALNWVRARGVIPILGARKPEQLADNLGCLDFHLEPDVLRRLDEASAVAPGYPQDFIEWTRPISSGGFADRIDR